MPSPHEASAGSEFVPSLDRNARSRISRNFTRSPSRHGKDEDIDIWDFAASNGYAIVSKDKDFYQRSVAMGHPPKVIHLHIGNCSVKETAAILLARPGHVRDFLSHETKSYLILP